MSKNVAYENMLWKEMKTAPTDGTKILATGFGLEWPEVIYYERYDDVTAAQIDEVGYWRYADDVFADIAVIENEDFTHWIAIPSPIAAAGDRS